MARSKQSEIPKTNLRNSGASPKKINVHGRGETTDEETASEKAIYFGALQRKYAAQTIAGAFRQGR